ncbi:MAG TPA: DUF3574 domain-containing protein [Acetobacteraceae bacterium]|nr:DUF3574 domain-containing protein [Acetobacteraceae bacterium]
MTRVLLALAALALGSGPALADETCPFPGQQPKLVVQLFFSQSVKGRGPVGPRAWQRFLTETVTPALPAGFTVYDAYGQWMDPRTHALSREQTKVIVVADDDTPEFRARVDRVASTYRRQFRQQSVGVLTNSGCGAF